MDLFNYIVILGKSFLWTSRCSIPSLSHFIRILVIKYETEKLVYFKLNKVNLFKENCRQILEEKNYITFRIDNGIIRNIFK